MNDAEAIASFRYRLREAARVALELGDSLLAGTQTHGAPNQEQLTDLRYLESSLDVCTRLYLPDILPAKGVDKLLKAIHG